MSYVQEALDTIPLTKWRKSLLIKEVEELRERIKDQSSTIDELGAEFREYRTENLELLKERDKFKTQLDKLFELI